MAILLPLSHLEIEASNDSWLLRVDGRPVDIAGHLSEQYTALTRSCAQVRAVRATDHVHADALRAIQQYSPPDSMSAQLVSLTRQDQWLLAQVRFNALQDAVVLLQETGHGPVIAEGGVWSGATHPHRPEPFVRRYLQSRVPQAPADLTACLTTVLSPAQD